MHMMRGAATLIVERIANRAEADKNDYLRLHQCSSNNSLFSCVYPMTCQKMYLKMNVYSTLLPDTKDTDWYGKQMQIFD